MEIKAIIFDLGGVLFSNGSRCLGSKLLSNGLRCSEIFTSEMCEMLRTGKITYSKFLNWLQEKLPDDITPNEFMLLWFDEYKIHPNLFELIKRMNKIYFIVSFSGNIAERIDYLDRMYCFRKFFDLEVYSYHANTNKNSEKFYQFLKQKIPCEPSECLLIDDNKDYIKLARKFGFYAYHYTSYGKLLKYLRERSIFPLKSAYHLREGGDMFDFYFGQKIRYEHNTSNKIYWIAISTLWLRGYRLRPAGEIAVTLDNKFQNKTPSVYDIARTLKSKKYFHNQPILVSKELGKLIVYEGRHRIIAARIADRTFILAKFISQNHPKVLDQKNPRRMRYYRKRIVSIQKFYDYHLTYLL